MPTCVSILIRASSVDYLMPICVSIFIQASSVDIPAKGSTKAQKKTEKSKQDKKGQSTSEHEVFAVYGTVFVYYWRHLRFSFPPFWLRSFSMPSSFFVTTFLVAVIFRWHLRSSMPSSFFDAIFVFRYHICSLPPFCCDHFSLASSFFDVIFIFRCPLRFSCSYFFFVTTFLLLSFFADIFVFRCHLRFSMPSSFFIFIFLRYHFFCCDHFSLASSFLLIAFVLLFILLVFLFITLFVFLLVVINRINFTFNFLNQFLFSYLFWCLYFFLFTCYFHPSSVFLKFSASWSLSHFFTIFASKLIIHFSITAFSSSHCGS